MIRLRCTRCSNPIFRFGDDVFKHENRGPPPKGWDHQPTVDLERTRALLAQDALDVQDACNLGGVALGLHEAINDLRNVEQLGTHDLNTHTPWSRLWVNKLVSLSMPGCELRVADTFSADYEYAAHRCASTRRAA